MTTRKELFQQIALESGELYDKGPQINGTQAVDSTYEDHMPDESDNLTVLTETGDDIKADNVVVDDLVSDIMAVESLRVTLNQTSSLSPQATAALHTSINAIVGHHTELTQMSLESFVSTTPVTRHVLALEAIGETILRLIVKLKTHLIALSQKIIQWVLRATHKASFLKRKLIALDERAKLSKQATPQNHLIEVPEHAAFIGHEPGGTEVLHQLMTVAHISKALFSNELNVSHPTFSSHGESWDGVQSAFNKFHTMLPDHTATSEIGTSSVELPGKKRFVVEAPRQLTAVNIHALKILLEDQPASNTTHSSIRALSGLAIGNMCNVLAVMLNDFIAYKEVAKHRAVMQQQFIKAIESEARNNPTGTVQSEMLITGISGFFGRQDAAVMAFMGYAYVLTRECIKLGEESLGAQHDPAKIQ